MAKLSQLVIEGDRKAPEKNRNLTIIKQSYTAIELFMHFFPKTEIDGAGKLTIHFSPKPDDKPDYQYSQFFHISIYYVSEELQTRAGTLNPDEKDGFYLDVIGNVLSDIAKRSEKAELLPSIQNAVQEAKNTGYRLLLPIKKLSKSSSDRRYKAVTFRYLTTEGELDFVEITDSQKARHTYVISNGVDTFPLDWYAVKCEWEKNRFIIKDRQDCVRASIDADLKKMHCIQNKSTTFTELDI